MIIIMKEARLCLINISRYTEYITMYHTLRVVWYRVRISILHMQEAARLHNSNVNYLGLFGV